jgi:hypothetical protein
MTATTLTSSWTQGRAPSLPDVRPASDRIAIGFLSVCLLVSYLQYCLERSDVVRLVPIVLLMMGAFLFLVTCPRDRRREILMSVTRPANLGIIAAVTVPPVASSLFYRPTLFPFEYGMIMIAVLIVLRILLSAIGFEGILVSFFYATSVGILVVAGLNFSELLTSIGSARFAPPYYDPNRIAFFAATAIPVQLWFVARRRRYSVLLLTALCVLVMIAASSRGSIGALLIGGLATTILYLVKQSRSGTFAISRNKLIGTLALLCVLTCIAGVEQRAVADSGRYLATKLALDDSERGLNTGFTGRTIYWAELTQILPKTFWVIGNGFRTSDEDFNFPVDNGYLAGLYELGLFSAVIVLAKYVFIVYFLAAVYLRNAWAEGSCVPVLFFTLVIFFANAYVHRVFFGIGEQASILALFTFVGNRQDVLRMLQLPAIFQRSWPECR